MFYVILNPTSKSGRGIRIWSKLEPIMKASGKEYKLLYSERIGHISELVAETLAANPDMNPVRFIILGGDGSMNEALQGVDDFSRVQFGYIPTGSSNDLARDLGYSQDPADILAEILKEKVVHTMDMGIVTYNDHTEVPSRRFNVSAGLGFDAAVCYSAMNTGGVKGLLNNIGLGKLTYVTIALQQLLGLHSISCDMILDENVSLHLDKFYFIAFMHHRYEGGGFMFCPEANATDGVMDLCIAGPLSKAKILMAIPLAYWGKHTRFEHVDTLKAHTARIKTSEPLWLHTDGETLYQTADVTITLQEKAIQLLA